MLKIVFALIIVSLVVAFSVPIRCSDQAFQMGAQVKIAQYSATLKLYKLDNGAYPTTEEGLAALVSKPVDRENWRQLVQKIDRDPWGNNYYYQFPGTKNSSSFDLWSFGADGVAGGEGINADVYNIVDSS